MFACEHLTPEPMRRPAWLAHPNGARAIHSCTIAASDPAPLREAMARLFGAAAITVTDEVVAAHTGHGVLIAAPPEDAQLMHPMAELPEHLPEPRLVALSVTVTDRDRAADFLRLQGVEFERSPNGDVLLPPARHTDVALELVRGRAPRTAGTRQWGRLEIDALVSARTEGVHRCCEWRGSPFQCVVVVVLVAGALAWVTCFPIRSSTRWNGC